MKIRKAGPTDAAACARVHIDSWKTTYAGIVPQEYLDNLSAGQHLTDWERMLSDSSGLLFFFVAETENGEIIGFAGGGPERVGNKTYTGELAGIYLLKSFQRKGIGHRLVAAVAGRLMQQGHVSMLVWVLADNPYKTFYEKLGGTLLEDAKGVTVAGTNLIELAYGWKDISGLAGKNDGTI